MMDEVGPSADDLLAAPIGVALLDRLESAQRGLFRPFDALTDSDPVAVERAVAKVEAMSVGQFLQVALEAADSLAMAYELASERQSLAGAICRHFGDALSGPFLPESQEYWLNGLEPSMPVEPGFSDFSRVYGNGEFTWSGLWTVSAPPDEVHDHLVHAWEMGPEPISRWRLPVREGARVWIIDHPSDWVRLVETFRKVAMAPHAGWELPGPNQHSSEVARLAQVPGQHAVRTVVDRHVLPDWTAVAQEYDGVHLSWAGYLTAEGFVSELSGGGVTMLRYWGSERTLWLHDTFGDPEPLGAPTLSGMLGIDASRGSARTSTDGARIAIRLST